MWMKYYYIFFVVLLLVVSHCNGKRMDRKKPRGEGNPEGEWEINGPTLWFSYGEVS